MFLKDKSNIETVKDHEHNAGEQTRTVHR